ncbi:MAG: MATE family efflux transporter [Sandaracinaceae bacterium]|nr:MATE family efflux transporter [Sandaracinaceae bacterium]
MAEVDVASSEKIPFIHWADAKRIIILAVPAMLALLTQTLVNTVDTYFFGKLPEPDHTDGQAMLSVALPLLWGIGGFFAAISVGTQSMVARREGQGEPQAAGAVLMNAVVLAVGVSVVVAIIGYYSVGAIYRVYLNLSATMGSFSGGSAGSDVALNRMASDAHFNNVAIGYTQWRFVGVVPLVITAAYKAYFDGTGRTYVHFVAAVVMNVANVILCWLLIFGNMGMPRMGVAGAGVAAAASSWVGLFVVILFSFGKKDRKDRSPYRANTISRKTVWEIARISIPSGFATTIVMLGVLLFRQIIQALDSQLGPDSEAINGAATTIIIQVLSMMFFACLALGVATATLVSQELGAGRPNAAERVAWTSVRLGAILFTVLGALQVMFPESLMLLFKASPGVMHVGVNALRLMGACGPLIAFAMIFTQALFGAGNTRYVMWVELCLHFLWLVPGAFIFGVWFKGGLFGVWAVAAGYIALLAFFMWLEFRRGRWKTIKI